MSARPRPRPTSTGTGFAGVLDQTLSSDRMRSVAHPEDWPDPTHEPGLPQGVWDSALGNIARDILGRPSRQFRARLCGLAWRLANGQGEVPFVLTAMVEILHAGSLIVDDIEDASDERRGAPCLHLVHGVPKALNTGNWMYFWALELVEQLESSSATRHRLRHALGETMYRCHLGQAVDLSVPVGEIPRAWVYRTVATSTMLKTGALMELAARLGAIGAGAPDDRIEALARFGRRLGLGLQMLDDFGNLTAPTSESTNSKALEDLRNGRPTWPWAHAARELDESTFVDLQSDARAVQQLQQSQPPQDSDDQRPRALAAKLRMAVGLTGRRQAAGYLQDALRDLRACVGQRGELGLLADEIQRLEASYG